MIYHREKLIPSDKQMQFTLIIALTQTRRERKD